MRLEDPPMRIVSLLLLLALPIAGCHREEASAPAVEPARGAAPPGTDPSVAAPAAPLPPASGSATAPTAGPAEPARGSAPTTPSVEAPATTPRPRPAPAPPGNTRGAPAARERPAATTAEIAAPSPPTPQAAVEADAGPATQTPPQPAVVVTPTAAPPRAETPAPPAASPLAASARVAAAPPAAGPELDLKALQDQLRQTKAIGFMTKLTLKGQVDDLLDRFREFYRGKAKLTMSDLRRSYDLLMMKVLSLLQDADQQLASAIVASREAIWGLLADPVKFETLQG